MSVSYYKNLGRYNWAGSGKQWAVVLNTQFGNISQTWDEDQEPEIDGLLPSEVLDLIEQRLASYWICTSRDKDMAKIAAIREHSSEIDGMWLDARIAETERKLIEFRELRAGLAEAVTP